MGSGSATPSTPSSPCAESAKKRAYLKKPSTPRFATMLMAGSTRRLRSSSERDRRRAIQKSKSAVPSSSGTQRQSHAP